jgi:hypothetical protein
VRQIELNMERWRWLPPAMGERYILVNIANFALDVVEHGRSVLAMRVVAGKPARRTPFFSADMTYLVLSPHWYVPPTIAIQDKLPLIRRDPGYVSRQNFKLFRHGEGGVRRVNPRSVDWSDERSPRRKSAVSRRVSPPLLSCGCKAGRRPAPQYHASACGDGSCQPVNNAEKSRYGVRHGGPSAWR